MRWLLGLVVMIAAMAPGVAMAQASTPAACGLSDIIGGKVVPQETDAGLFFAGEAGSFVSEPFDLPEGTLLFATSMDDAENGLAQVVAAPRSTASGGGNVGFVIMGTETAMAGSLQVYDAGAFVLTVTSDVPWRVALEF